MSDFSAIYSSLLTLSAPNTPYNILVNSDSGAASHIITEESKFVKFDSHFNAKNHY